MYGINPKEIHDCVVMPYAFGDAILGFAEMPYQSFGLDKNPPPGGDFWKGPKEKDSTAVGSTANAPEDRKGPIPPENPSQNKKAPKRGAFCFGAGDGNRTRTVSLGS